MKKYIYSLLAGAMLASAGCESKLDLNNPNIATTGTFWQTEADAVAAVNSIYNSLIIDGTYMRMIPCLMDGRADDFQGDSPWPDLMLVANFTIPTTSGPVAWVWEAHYQLVWRANQVLANVPSIEMDQDLKNRVLGQAYFLRGLAYFNLANFYKEVPLITTLPADRTEFYPETASEEDIWNQIISDFTEAKANLPVNYLNVNGPDRGNVGRATSGAATGMLGKALVYRQRWAEATQQFAELVGGQHGAYRLMENYRDNFDPRTENNAESLFEVQFAMPSEVGGSELNWGGNPNANWTQVSAQAITYAARGYGFNDFLPTRTLYNDFHIEQTIDGRKDPRLLATIASFEPTENSTRLYNDQWPYSPDEIYPRKYTNDGFGPSVEEQFRSGINYRILRYADILMLHAEALNELGRTAEAYGFIQQVRNRANLPDLATVKPAMSQEEMRDQIAHERFLEFAIEGQRINDLVRWGWFEDPAKLAFLRSRDSEFNTFTPGNQWLPIPQGELDNNPNLSPNSANN
ncbi:RagB/SusD family nutrient uptake outer membrane protein [Belliella sp. DSM 107340]|uniref:RagB/SusD family nutrient uptake outer membrane protein n=1 Tax=Belliella calami TaxID=2923436 RepID=A0ABS9UP96_9BACT|nr:RagB/SusD family nutrient uptake outer membrane protein [Belliella calami]MCH7398284.1 RagB/SusD family nutrient uptake outer membrane protein [Belliella calami]